jgi:hypothetical protein
VIVAAIETAEDSRGFLMSTKFIVIEPATNAQILGSKPEFDTRKEAEIEASWLYHLYGWSVAVAKK